MPLQPSVVPSHLSTPLSSSWIVSNTGRAFINFYSEQLRKYSKLYAFCIAERKICNWFEASIFRKN